MFDTIKVGRALNISFNETVWRPDSKKVIIEQWIGDQVAAFTFDLARKDTSFVDAGSNFIWSPLDKDLIAYIKDYSVYSKNMRTGKIELIFKGWEKKRVISFRWDPSGEFMLIEIDGYFLNLLSYITWNPTHTYLSISTKTQSKIIEGSERIDTWKYVTGANKLP